MAAMFKKLLTVFAAAALTFASLALAHSVLLLVSGRPFALPATIRSRCQSLRFSAQSRQQVEAALIATRGLTQPDARFLAAVAQGRLGEAFRTDLTEARAKQREYATITAASSLQSVATVLAAAELYDPMTGAWANTNPMNVPRQTFTATVLPIGTVLAAGGLTTGGSLTLTAETYRPLSGTWSITGSLITARQAHTATVLTFGPNGGKVLAAGGQNAFGNGIATAEIYDPASGGWAATGALNQGRAFSTATVLPNGTVLAAGGTTVLVATTNSTEIYNPATGSWAMSGALKNVRAKHTATLLPTSQVLAAGGSFSGVPLASSELFSSSVP